MRTLVIAALVLVFGTSFAHARKWTDSTGKFSIEGDFIEVKDGKIRIQKDAGGVASIPLEKLSEVDQKFLEKQNAAKDDSEDSKSGNGDSKNGKGDSKSRARETFVAAIKQAFTKKNPQLLMKHIYEFKKCSPLAIAMWSGEIAKNSNKKLKDVTIVDDTQGVPGMDFPLPVAGKLEITFEEEGKEGKSKSVSVPLGFKGGAYYFMVPKQMMEK